MASMTSLDNRSLAAFTLHQKKIFRRNRLLDAAPHIGSHTVTRVWRCTDEYVYRDPVQLGGRFEKRYERNEGVNHDDWSAAVRDLGEMAVVTEWRFDETGCNTISCNPYYPGRGVCKGYDDGGAKERETPFAFTTDHNQRIDACQPICYDEDQVKDTYVGMMSLYAKKGHMCYVTDPELIAFYLDPHRRVFDEKEQIVEKSAFKIVPEYLGPTGVPALVAKIGKDYCDQYGLDYVEERGEANVYGGGNIIHGSCKVDKNEGELTALSTWTGNTITRAFNFGRNSFLGATSAVKNKKLPPPFKGPTTLKYLNDETAWRSNVDVTKKPLPFPLKLTDLGLYDKHEGLMWTDEYSFIDDGRNDAYGGRLVERPRGIVRPPWSIVEFGDERAFNTTDSHGVRLNEITRDTISRVRREANEKLNAVNEGIGEIHASDNSDTHLPNGIASESIDSNVNGVVPNNDNNGDDDNNDDNNVERSERLFVRHLQRSIKEHERLVATLSGLKDSVAGSSLEIMVEQFVAGTTVDTLGDLFKDLGKDSARITDTLKSALKTSLRNVGSTLSTDGIGLVVTQSALRTRIETRIVNTSSSMLKLPFRALSRGANILSLIALLGAAADLFSAFVYNPYSKYDRYMSDRLLRALAQAELVMNQRLIGRQRLLLEPSEWMVNTRYLDRLEDSTYDMLLGMLYTRARRVNSNGSIIYWYKRGGLRRNNDGQLVYFDKSATKSAVQNDDVFHTDKGKDNRKETGTHDEEPQRDDDLLRDTSSSEYKSDSISLYVAFLFVIVASIALTGLTRAATTRWILPVTVLTTVLLLIFPASLHCTRKR